MNEHDSSEIFIKQLDDINLEYESYRQRGIGNLPESTLIQFVTRFRAAIHRIAPPNSVYIKQCEEIINVTPYAYAYKADGLYGIITSIRKDLSSGYLDSITELIHGELFGDFLTMSQHLLKEGYKDAAAVIAGSALEAHLRQLCIKAGIETEIERDDKLQPKKADRMNSEFVAADVYKKLDQKNVTAWLDLRNDAAHGHYEKYTKEQVSLMISGIRDFLTRNPA